MNTTRQIIDNNGEVRQVVDIDGDTWKISGVGVTREDGKTFCHLVSTTRGRMQKNGWYPIQMGDWVTL